MKTEELIIKVTQWANDRNIIDGCPPIKQAYKTLEECGELIEWVSKKDVTQNGYDTEHCMDQVKDAIGDITVTLIIQCAMQGIDFVDCLEGAYNTIKDRKGRLVNGQFLKEAETNINDAYYYLVDGDMVRKGDEVDINENGHSWVATEDVDYVYDPSIYVPHRRKA